MRWAMAAAAALLIAGIAVAMMKQARPSLPTVIPTVEGRITKMDQQPRILVEAEPGRDQGDKCWFGLLPRTEVLRQSGDRLVRAAITDLAPGVKVQAWATGPIRKSYPCQAEAQVILILN